MKLTLRTMPHPLPDVCHPIAGWLLARPELHTVAIFAPLPGEPDLLRLPDLVAARSWCFPRVVDARRLAFHRASDISGFRASAFGVREPAPDAPGVSSKAIDAFLCPGLAFTRDGGRLGHGRGYYDRLLADARADAVKVGVCFACQVVEADIIEPHDVPMDFVISELGVATPAERA